MNAPNKLFLHETKVARPSWHHGRVAEGDVEYIRKGLLIEWLNGVKADPMIPMNIDKVIDYIKAL